MTKKLAQTALLAAVSVAVLALGLAMPGAKLGLAAAAGIAVGVCRLVAGRRYAWLCWLAASLLALWLPSPALTLSFALFFGPYPLVKAFAERKKPVWEWSVKLLLGNGAAALALFLLWRFFTLPKLPLAWPALLLLGNGVFLLYDFGLSRLLFFLERRLARFFG